MGELKGLLAENAPGVRQFSLNLPAPTGPSPSDLQTRVYIGAENRFGLIDLPCLCRFSPTSRLGRGVFSGSPACAFPNQARLQSQIHQPVMVVVSVTRMPSMDLSGGFLDACTAVWRPMPLSLTPIISHSRSRSLSLICSKRLLGCLAKFNLLSKDCLFWAAVDLSPVLTSVVRRDRPNQGATVRSNTGRSKGDDAIIIVSPD